MCYEKLKTMPLIKSKFSKLSGYAVSKSTNKQITITGTLYLEDSQPFFKGNADQSSFKYDDKYNIILTDNNSISYKLYKCQLFNTDIFTSYTFRVMEVNISCGNIDTNDSCKFFSIIRTDKFIGKYFDILGRRNIIKLDYVKSGMRLYYKPISEIESAKGYLYYSNTLSTLDNYIDEIIPTLCSLISFGMGNFAGFPYHLIWKNDNNYKIILKGDNFTREGTGIFYVEYPNILSDLIECGWQGWKHHSPSINLPVLIDYYVLIANQKHIESKMLLACVWMEAMKHQYAKNVRNYLVNRGGYFLKPGSSNKFSFLELVQEVYNYYNVSGGDLSFIVYRNEVIHQGQINLLFPQKLHQFNKLITSIEYILLDILQFNGKVWSRDNDNYVNFPP